MASSRRTYRHCKVLHEAFVARLYDQEQTPALGQQYWILDGNYPNMGHACHARYNKQTRKRISSTAVKAVGGLPAQSLRFPYLSFINSSPTNPCIQILPTWALKPANITYYLDPYTFL